ncbi:MAG: mobile mystery protein A, partial [Flavobacteriaceae bacterium]|nr:mobile mystery protein A [Flavobacteriaceae bacterium]
FTLKFICKLKSLRIMRNKKKLIIEQLDQKLKPFQKTGMVLIPNKGWINTIRTALNMTMAQLGTKLNITRQGVKSIEESEVKGTISINSLKEVGKALDLKFVYGFVPKDGTIDNLINLKSEKLAKKIVLRTNQNMKLEDQGIGDKKINKSIKDLANEIKREMRKSLWD